MGQAAPSPPPQDGVVFRTPSPPGSNLVFQEYFEPLRSILLPSIPWSRFADILNGQNQGTKTRGQDDKVC
jgi:hypothetical protein